MGRGFLKICLSFLNCYLLFKKPQYATLRRWNNRKNPMLLKDKCMVNWVYIVEKISREEIMDNEWWVLLAGYRTCSTIIEQYRSSSHFPNKFIGFLAPSVKQEVNRIKNRVNSVINYLENKWFNFGVKIVLAVEAKIIYRFSCTKFWGNK